MNESLYLLLLEHLTSDEKLEPRVAAVIDTACTDPGALENVFCGEGDPTSLEAKSRAKETPQHCGTFLERLEVEGFRGIGEPATLRFEAGPGLTLVIGRNGSGKSSLAEGLETLLTGNNSRWSGRKTNKAEWEGGWRNLHHNGPVSLDGQFTVEGSSQPISIRRFWDADATTFTESNIAVRRHSKSPDGMNELGWADALNVHRPFLSYNELGNLYEKPSQLFDSLRSILGLDDLNGPLRTLADIRKGKQKKAQLVTQQQKSLAVELENLDDERAKTCLEAIQGRKRDLDTIESVVLSDADVEDDRSVLAALRQLASLKAPNLETTLELADNLRTAVRQQREFDHTEGTQQTKVIDLLERAIRFFDDFGDQDCPVCGQSKALNPGWRKDTETTLAELRSVAGDVLNARKKLDHLVRQAQNFIRSVHPPKTGLEEAIFDTSAAQLLAERWLAGAELVEPAAIASHLENEWEPLSKEFEALAEGAKSALDKREDLWRPLARKLSAWLVDAQEVASDKEKLKALKQAEKWLKNFTAMVRDERFEPIAEQAQQIWRTLRQDSNVDLAKVELTGRATRRTVRLNVTVDGEDGAALGVMSQGELHALALSLFLPRVMLDESPFRFVVIDDPVQSMDPARVDGLARVLERVAKIRQVIVFTHDDRLAQAIRRLQIAADIREVERRGRSVVEIIQSLRPEDRYIEDAYSVAKSERQIGAKIANRVVPGLCRMALETALASAVRRRRLGRGERHREVELTIDSATSLNSLAALALFDDSNRGGEVMRTINNKFGRQAGDVFVGVKKGAHHGFRGDCSDLVRQVRRLARQLEAL